MSKFLTVGIYTLGCKVNQYESEAIAEEFKKRNFEVLSPDRKCDIYVINTCTVTAESDRKARQFTRRAISGNPEAYIIVTGCMAQTQVKRTASISGVDAVCGNDRKMKAVDIAERLVANGRKPDEPIIDVEDINLAGFEPMCISRFDRTRAYVKIEDGCESHCAYCEIPLARGKIRSKPLDDVISEVKGLVAGGCREIVLTGIETGSWGKDIGGNFADLLVAVDSVPGIERVRLGSLDPAIIRPDFIEKISNLKSLTPHFHFSMQSGSTHVLNLMKRKYNADMALERLNALREAIPGVQFTTDMIEGFPQETDSDFEETLEFAKSAKFLMMHVFPYSRRAGTVADKMSGQIPEQIKHERAAKLAEVAANVRREILDGIVAAKKPLEVLFESFENGVAFGHSLEFIAVSVKSEIPLTASVFTVIPESHDGMNVTGKISVK